MPTLSIAMRVPYADRGPARRAGNRVCAALGTAVRLAQRGAGIRRDPVNERYAATTPSRARRRLVESLTVLVATGHRLSAKRRIWRNREARPRGTSSFASLGGSGLARQRGLRRLESVAQVRSNARVLCSVLHGIAWPFQDARMRTAAGEWYLRRGPSRTQQQPAGTKTLFSLSSYSKQMLRVQYACNRERTDLFENIVLPEPRPIPLDPRKT